MLALLRRHYLPEGRQPGGIFAPEIEAPAGGRRADLIWQGCTSAWGRNLIGHEIKVSRADVLVELGDPSKTDPWQRYCDRWWLVVADPALVEGLDLPPSWGVMAPPSGRRTRSMTVLVDAPKLVPDDQAAGYATVGRWLHWRHHELTVALAREKDYRRSAEERMRRAEATAPRSSPTRDAVAAIAVEVVARLGGVAHPGVVGDWSNRVAVDDVVTALVDLAQLYQKAESIGWAAKTVIRASRDLARGIDAQRIAELDAAVAAIPEPGRKTA